MCVYSNLGSRWKCEVSDPSSKLSMNGDSLKSFSVRQTASLEVTAVGCKKDQIKVNIIGKKKFIIIFIIFFFLSQMIYSVWVTQYLIQLNYEI